MTITRRRTKPVATGDDKPPQRVSTIAKRAKPEERTPLQGSSDAAAMRDLEKHCEQQLQLIAAHVAGDADCAVVSDALLSLRRVLHALASRAQGSGSASQRLCRHCQSLDQLIPAVVSAMRDGLLVRRRCKSGVRTGTNTPNAPDALARARFEGCETALAALAVGADRAADFADGLCIDERRIALRAADLLDEWFEDSAVRAEEFFSWMEGEGIALRSELLKLMPLASSALSLKSPSGKTTPAWKARLWRDADAIWQRNIKVAPNAPIDTRGIAEELWLRKAVGARGSVISTGYILRHGLKGWKPPSSD
jgi:hypothetical protein